MIYTKQPNNFSPKFEIVSCFVEDQGKILLLLRQDHKPEGNTWGVPAGKIGKGENIFQTIIREIKEETGFNIPKSQIAYFDKVFVKYPSYDFVYHIFYTKLNKESKVKINDAEHKDFKWTTPQNSLILPLIQDLDACIKLFYKI